jgi:hypothetical protein
MESLVLRDGFCVLLALLLRVFIIMSVEKALLLILLLLLTFEGSKLKIKRIEALARVFLEIAFELLDVDDGDVLVVDLGREFNSVRRVAQEVVERKKYELVVEVL